MKDREFWEDFIDEVVYNPYKPDCPENENLLTNFDVEDYDRYRCAIYIYNRDVENPKELWIRKDAFYGNSYRLDNHMSLHVRRKKVVGDMSPYWRILDKMKDPEYFNKCMNVMNRTQKIKKIL